MKKYCSDCDIAFNDERCPMCKMMLRLEDAREEINNLYEQLEDKNNE